MGVAERLGPYGPRAIARFYRTRDLDVRVEGLAHLPRRGAALLAARHYHHLYDGAALIDALPRKPAVFVALDWAATPRIRAAMELACRLAGWPMALRSTHPSGSERGRAYDRSEVLAYVRRAIAAGADVLGRGDVLVVFPEGYPTREPGDRLAKEADDTILPFREGLLAIVTLAQRRGAGGSRPRVPILPVGLAYEKATSRKRYRVVVRIGEPRYFDPRHDDRAAFVADLESAVRTLSFEAPAATPSPFAPPRRIVIHDELRTVRDDLDAARHARELRRDHDRGRIDGARARLTAARDARRAGRVAELRRVARDLASRAAPRTTEHGDR